MQHDANIANQTFPAFRADLNNALAAIFSSSAGNSAPSTTLPGQSWYDTANNTLWVRNASNNAWIKLFDFAANQAIFGGRIGAINGSPGNPSVGFASDGDSGLYLAAADRPAMSAAATKVMEWSDAQVESLVRFVAKTIVASEQYLAPGSDGAGKPGFSWNGDTKTGLYRAGANAIGFTIDGTSRGVMDKDKLTLGMQLRALQGSVATPGLSFDGRSGTGLFVNGDNNLCVAVNGVKLAEFGNTRVICRPEGDGSLLDTLNKAVVGAAIAAAALGDVGTYAFLARKSGTAGFTAGETYAGVNLAYAGIVNSAVHIGGNSPSGSWLCVGSAGDGTCPATMFKRV